MLSLFTSRGTHLQKTGGIKIGKYDAQTAWKAENTTRIAVALNNRTDADIIHYLETVPSKQGAIKQALRELIERVTSADDQR